jgi:oxygen-independent coproporphyrinogen-3 oxidase
MSAIGSVGDHYIQNRRELAAYRQSVGAEGAACFRGIRLSDEDKLRRAVIGNLLCHGVVVKSEIEARFGIAFDAHFADALERLEACAADGLVVLTREEIRATELGRVFLRNLAMPFDAYLEAAPERPVYSRTL